LLKDGREAPMAARSIDLWFTMGSTYTYLTMARLDGVVGPADVLVRLRPFRNVGDLTGATQLPFLEGTAKMRYMWRDIERRAAKHGLPIHLPVPYPVPSSARANSVAVVGEENLRASLAECGQAQHVDRILEAADSADVTRELDAATEEARQQGVFGSPAFAVGTKLFWGDDNLEAAVQWARRGRLGASPLAV
jgi:2-hydroxychromene-2-carboxylate isomerase